jgi:hypothetical protein
MMHTKVCVNGYDSFHVPGGGLLMGCAEVRSPKADARGLGIFPKSGGYRGLKND